MKLLDNQLYKKFLNFSEILKRIEYGYLNKPGFLVGDELVKYPDRYIHFCLSMIQQQNLFIDGSSKCWICIDGNKRLKTILDFINNKFTTTDGLYYNDLPGYLKHRIMNNKFEAYIFYPGAKDIETIMKYIKELE